MAEEAEDTNNTANAVWITFLCSLVALVVVAFVYHGTERTRERERKSHLYYWGFGIAVIVLLPLTGVASYVFTALTVTTVGTVFPIYESIRAVCTPEEEDDKAWLQYWMVGGVLFIATQWVDDVLGATGAVYWYSSLFFFLVWLFLPITAGAALIYEFVTAPYIVPRVRPLAAKMTNMLSALYQTMINAVHLWFVWLIFMFLPPSLKRLVAVAIGTVYPLVSSIAAASTEEVEDDTYWLTYWSCYGILFLIMDVLETWLGWIPGFYTLVILTTVYLMLPMMNGADKIFRKILVPLAGLQEMLMLRDAIAVKKSMLRDLDPERARVVRKAIAKFYDDDDDRADPGELKQELLTSWQGLKMPSMMPPLFSNPFSKKQSEDAEAPSETTPLSV